MKIAILGSGRGSNAAAILDTHSKKRLGDVEIVGIISDKPDAKILDVAKQHKVPGLFIDPGHYKTKLTGDAEDAYIAQLKAWGADLIVLAGFMRVVKVNLLQAFDCHIINLHPSLLPKYPGLHSIKRAIEAGDEEAGCTVHWVNDKIDEGEIIRQSIVRIAPDETVETLEKKINAAEHILLPSVIKELSMRPLPKF